MVLKTEKCLTKLQNQVLETVACHSRGAHLLSSRDLIRIMPNKTRCIDQSVAYLQNRGLIKTVKANGTVHYCSSEEIKRLRKKAREIALDDKIEREIVRIVRVFLQRLYPDALKSGRTNAASSRESGRFDIVLEFKTPVLRKQCVVADVYTKIEVTKDIVQSFIRKLRWVRNETNLSGDETRNTYYRLREKILGMLVCNNVSQEAIDAAQEKDIPLLSLKEMHIDFNQIQEKMSFTRKVHC